MKAGIFTDTGSRIRLNSFQKADGIIQNYNSKYETSQFYDYKDFNHDTYEVGFPNEESNPEQTKIRPDLTQNENRNSAIAEMYFRLDVDHVVHERNVYHIMEWLGDIGGIKDLLMDIAIAIMGSWMAFNKAMEFMNALYYSEEDNKKISMVFRRLKTS